jgi:hypothetical protein
MVAGVAGCTPGAVAVVLSIAARFIDDGDAAGCRPAAATACGVAPAEGNVGAAEFDARAVSSDDFQGVHHAQRGPDWQPTNPATRLTNINEWTAVRFIDKFSMFAGMQFDPAFAAETCTSVRFFGALARRH